MSAAPPPPAAAALQKSVLLTRASRVGASVRGGGGPPKAAPAAPQQLQQLLHPHPHASAVGTPADFARVDAALRGRAAMARDVEGICARIDEVVSDWTAMDGGGADAAENSDILRTMSRLEGASPPTKGSNVLEGIAEWLSRTQDEARDLFTDVDLHDSRDPSMRPVDVAKGTVEAARVRGEVISDLSGTARKFKDTAEAME